MVLAAGGGPLDGWGGMVNSWSRRTAHVTTVHAALAPAAPAPAPAPAPARKALAAFADTL